MKKSLSLALVFVLVLTCAPVLGIAEEEQTYIERVGYTPKTDKLTIQTTNRVIAEGNLVDRWLEEQLGVQIDWIILSGDELSTKLNLLAASEELPDIVSLPSNTNTADYFSFIEQGLLIDLEDLLNSVGENIRAVRTEEQIEALRHTDGHLYALNSCTETDYDMTVIRKDWLDALGLEVPTTLDAFTDVLRAFKTEDPDGNGEADTYGYYVWNATNLIVAFNIFWAAFDANPLQWVWADDGSIVHGATEKEKMVAAIQYLNGLYNEGLLNEDLATADQQSYTDLALTDKQGATQTQLWYIDPYMQNMYLGSDTREWIALPALSHGDEPGGYLTQNNPDVRQYTCITVDSKDPELAMHYLNLIADLDTLTFVRLGIEGTHYYRDEAKGVLVPMEEYKNQTLLINDGITATYVMPFLAEDPVPGQCLESTMAVRDQRRANEAHLYAAIYAPIPAIEDAMLNAGMQDYIKQQVTAMIMEPELDAESAVQAMIDELYAKYNMEQQTELANEYAAEHGLTAQ